MKIHMLSGVEEYSSEASLTKLAGYLAREHGWCFTISRGAERGTDLPDLHHLDSADLLLVYCKRMTLPAEQLSRIQRWCGEGRPIVGIRTASHAFQSWLDFDRQYLGGSYNNHDGDDTVTNTVEPGQQNHPILRGISTWTAAGKVYLNPTLAADATVLMRAQNCRVAGQPLAWCRTVPSSGGRVFYTSIGHPHDFENPIFLKMVANGIAWAAEAAQPRYRIADLTAIPACACPCGQTRRAFTDDPAKAASIHMVDISHDSRAHYHKALTEIYLILEGSGHMELDGQLIPVKPMTSILIKPGCRHRAIGKMRIVNIPVPAFDPADEWFD